MDGYYIFKGDKPPLAILKISEVTPKTEVTWKPEVTCSLNHYCSFWGVPEGTPLSSSLALGSKGVNVCKTRAGPGQQP